MLHEVTLKKHQHVNYIDYALHFIIVLGAFIINIINILSFVLFTCHIFSVYKVDNMCVLYCT